MGGNKRVFADPLVSLVFGEMAGLGKIGQEGPNKGLGKLSAPIFPLLPSVSPASISEIFGVTHSNFS